MARPSIVEIEASCFGCGGLPVEIDTDLPDGDADRTPIRPPDCRRRLRSPK